MLLEAGASANKRGVESEPTPLHAASYTGSVHLAHLLCAYGADRTLPFLAPAYGGQPITPAQVALLHRNLPLASWLSATADWTTPLHHLEVLPARLSVNS